MPAIDWTMSPRLGGDLDGDGILDYPDSDAEVASGPFEVVLQARDDLCAPQADFHWIIAGERLADSIDACERRIQVAREGDYDVGLEVERDGEVRFYERQITVQDWLVVSIGDSVASGEGNPDRPGFLRRSSWQSSRCHRSTSAAPVRAALALERADRRTSVTLVHLACSGAQLRSGLLDPYAGADVPDRAQPPVLPPQVSELEAIDFQRSVDAVVLNIGANDLAFGPMVAFCIRRVNCLSETFEPQKYGDGQSLPASNLSEFVPAALAQVRHGYRELGDRLRRVIEPSRVLIVDYFDPTKDTAGEICRKIGIKLLPHWYIDSEEATFAADQVLTPLNAAIHEAAGREGWTEVTGVAEGFRHHGYCAGRKSWIRSLSRSLVTQAGVHLRSRAIGALHPNELGHEAIATLVFGALERTLSAGAGAPVPAEPEEEAEVLGGITETEGTGGVAHADLEDDVRSGLIAAACLLLLLLLASLIWRIWQSGPVPPAGASSSAAKIRADLPGRWEADELVTAFGDMVERSNEWVHRRVESIEFIDEHTIRRRVSVDFTPWPAPAVSSTLTPLAMLAKGVLTRFDLRDEEGRSVPMRTSEQNATLSTQHMLAVAEQATGQSPSERLRQLCWTIARGELAEADLAIEEIGERILSGQEPASLRDARFFELTTTFAARFPIVVDLEDSHRRVLKFASDEVVMKGPERLARVGIAPAVFQIDVPELGDAGSRHIEFISADGLEAKQARIVGRQPNGQRVAARSNLRDGREAHLVLSQVQRATPGVAEVRLWAERRGILTGGPLLATFAALALTFAWFALPELGNSSRDTASLLLAVPAAFVTYLGARDPHPLAAALLRGSRLLVVIAGAAGFGAAAGLALGYSSETLRVVLGAAALVTWLSVIGLLAIYLAPHRN